MPDEPERFEDRDRPPWCSGPRSPSWSTTATRPSDARSESAETQREADHLLRGLLRVASAASGRGPRRRPPTAGERVDPCRARPVPFCRNGLAPPPRTSARVLVDWVPARAAASWAVTTWWRTARLGSMPKIDGSRSTSPSSAPAADAAGAVRCSGPAARGGGPRPAGGAVDVGSGSRSSGSSGLRSLDERCLDRVAQDHDPAPRARAPPP